MTADDPDGSGATDGEPASGSVGGHSGGPAGEPAGGSLAATLGAALASRGLVFTAAESCTGGLIAAALTSVPGSSAWFGCGFVTYANAAKTSLLGVEVGTLDRHGAVSEAVVRAMASGARARAGADVAVAASGVAGPGGGSAAKPVGTVWLAWALPDGRVDASCHRFPGGRAEVRADAVAEALRGTIERLDRTLPGPH